MLLLRRPGSRGGEGGELAAVLKPDPRLLWDQFEEAASAVGEWPPDDLSESKVSRVQ